jgi:2-hydroxychromene-2-carboxylate isomerase
VGSVRVTHITDPGCPWAYSIEPSITTLRWRYGDQLDWRIVLIGLTESGSEYETRGYTPERQAGLGLSFGRFGMPFQTEPRTRVPGTGRACRAVVAARMDGVEAAYIALRALRFGWFTSTLLLDEDEQIAEALARAPELEVDAIMSRLDSPEVEEAYQRDREEARQAAGSPASMQGKTAIRDGVERYTAPTLIFEKGDNRLVAGGYQPIAGYDLCVANLDPTLSSRPEAETVGELLAEFPYGITTREVSLAMAIRNAEPDDAAATEALVELVASGAAHREQLGDDALWRPAAATARAAA